MAKVLFVDTAVFGHSSVYLQNVSTTVDEAIYFLPENNLIKNDKVWISEFTKYNKSFIGYVKWIRTIYRIAEKESVDIIHFLSADDIFRYGGIGFVHLKKRKVVLTFHHISYGWHRTIRYRYMLRNVTIGVVHTGVIYEDLIKKNIKNIVRIDYPCFMKIPVESVVKVKEKYSVPNNKKVILLIGVLNKYKGVEAFLEALKEVKEDFFFIIAGAPKYYDEQYIMSKASSFRGQVKCIMGYLEENMYGELIYISDIIAIPYTREFNGASGPLAEGAYMKKCIIGSNHGSLGSIVKDNHLGYTFDVENICDITEKIEKSLSVVYEYDDTALLYRERITQDYFLREYRNLFECLQR